MSKKTKIQDFVARTLYLPASIPVCIIGDVHGCLDEFKEVIRRNGWVIDSNDNMYPLPDTTITQFILVGDFIDKGYNVKGTIEFLYKNFMHFHIVKGNHENFVYKFLKKQLGSYKSQKKLIDKNFQTIFLLERDEELLNKFNFLVEQCFDFIESDRYVITHSPCKAEHVGQTSSKSVREQRNFVYPKRNDFKTTKEYVAAKQESLQFLLDDGDENGKLHFFGHIITKNVFFTKNKIAIDTGCAKNGYLTFAVVYPNKDVMFGQVPSKKRTHWFWKYFLRDKRENYFDGNTVTAVDNYCFSNSKYERIQTLLN